MQLPYYVVITYNNAVVYIRIIPRCMWSLRAWIRAYRVEILANVLIKDRNNWQKAVDLLEREIS